MSAIILATLNAKYIHASFGLRYLKANLGSLKEDCRILEFDIHQRPSDVVEAILREQPRIVGLGVYIWNARPTEEVVHLLKKVSPETILILGGPEVSFEAEDQAMVQAADHVIQGEADLVFADVCRQILDGQPPRERIIRAPLPKMEDLTLPYSLYDDDDVAHRVVYVEASRGCPFSCEFCLSSLDIPVRQVPLKPFLAELDNLLQRGVRQFKFVDRTFNLNLKISQAILEFFLKRHQEGHLYHFEMIPDRLPEGLRDLIARFPAGTLQFEVGIQSFNEEVCHRISRRQDVGRLEDNFHFLRGETGVHLHADLIVGLPGESMESFAAGFDQLVRLQPQEIQVGILKRLRGTPISRHDEDWDMVYNPRPPYDILRNRLYPFEAMQRMKRFARYWDLVANSGNFVGITSWLWSDGAPSQSPFAGFMAWSEWLYRQVGRTDAIGLPRLARLLFQYLTEECGREPQGTAEQLWADYQAGGRRDKPAFLHPYIPDGERQRPVARKAGGKRQARFLGESRSA